MYYNTFNSSVFKCLADIVLMCNDRKPNSFSTYYQIYERDPHNNCLCFRERRYDDIDLLWQLVSTNPVMQTSSNYGSITVIISDIILNVLWSVICDGYKTNLPGNIKDRCSYECYGIPVEVIDEVHTLSKSSDAPEIVNIINSQFNVSDNTMLKDLIMPNGAEGNKREIFFWLLQHTNYTTEPMPDNPKVEKRCFDSVLFGYYFSVLNYALNNRYSDKPYVVADSSGNIITKMTKTSSLDFASTMRKLVNSIRDEQRQLSVKKLAEIAASKPVISDGVFNRMKSRNSSIRDDENIKKTVTFKFIDYCKTVNLVSNSNLAGGFTDVQGILGRKMDIFISSNTFMIGDMSKESNTERINGKGSRFDISDKQASIELTDIKHEDLEDDISETLAYVEVLNKALFYKKNSGNMLTVFEWYARKLAEKDIKELYSIFNNNKTTTTISRNVEYSAAVPTEDYDVIENRIGAAQFNNKVKAGLGMLDFAYDIYCNVGSDDLKKAQQDICYQFSSYLGNSEANTSNYIVHGEDFYCYEDRFNLSPIDGKSGLFKDAQSKDLVDNILKEAKPGEIVLTSSGVDKINNLFNTFKCLERLERSLQNEGYHIYDLPLRELMSNKAMQKSLRGLLHLDNNRPTPLQVAKLETRWNSFSWLFNFEANNAVEQNLKLSHSTNNMSKLDLTSTRNSSRYILNSVNKHENFEKSILKITNHSPEDVYYIVIYKILKLAFPESIKTDTINIKMFNTQTDMIYRAHPRLEFYRNCNVKNMKIILGLMLMLYRYTYNLSSSARETSRFVKNVSRFFKYSRKVIGSDIGDFLDRHYNLIRLMAEHGGSNYMHKFSSDSNYHKVFIKNYDFLPDLSDCINRGDNYLFQQASFYVDVIGGCCVYYVKKKAFDVNNNSYKDIVDFLSDGKDKSYETNYNLEHIRFNFVAYNQAMDFKNQVYSFNLEEDFHKYGSKGFDDINNPIVALYRILANLATIDSDALYSRDTIRKCYCEAYTLKINNNVLNDFRKSLYNVSIYDFATRIPNKDVISTGNVNSDYARENYASSESIFFPLIYQIPEDIPSNTWEEMFDQNVLTNNNNSQKPEETLYKTSYDREHLYEKITYLTYEVFNTLFIRDNYKLTISSDDISYTEYNDAMFENVYNNYTVTPKLICDLVLSMLDSIAYTPSIPINDRCELDDILDKTITPVKVATTKVENDACVDITTWEKKGTVLDYILAQIKCYEDGVTTTEFTPSWNIINNIHNVLNKPNCMSAVLSDANIASLDSAYRIHLTNLTEESSHQIKADELDDLYGFVSKIYNKPKNSLTNEDVTDAIRRITSEDLISELKAVYNKYYMNIPLEMQTLPMFQEEYNPVGVAFSDSTLATIAYPESYYYSAITRDQEDRHGGSKVSLEAAYKRSFFSTVSPTFGFGFVIFVNYIRGRDLKVELLHELYPVAKCSKLIRDEQIRMLNKSGETRLDAYALTNFLCTNLSLKEFQKVYLEYVSAISTTFTVGSYAGMTGKKFDKKAKEEFFLSYNDNLTKIFSNNSNNTKNKCPFALLTDYFTAPSKYESDYVFDNNTANELNTKFKEYLVENTVNDAVGILNLTKVPVAECNSIITTITTNYLTDNPLSYENKGLLTASSDNENQLLIENKQSMYNVDKPYIKRFIESQSNNLKFATIMRTNNAIVSKPYTGDSTDCGIRVDYLGTVDVELDRENVLIPGSDVVSTNLINKYHHVEDYYIVVTRPADRAVVIVSADIYGLNCSEEYNLID